MTAFALIQALILALIGIGCLAQLLRRYCPHLWMRMVGRLRGGHPAATESPRHAANGCGSGGCPACSGCALKSQLRAASPTMRPPPGRSY